MILTDYLKPIIHYILFIQLRISRFEENINNTVVQCTVTEIKCKRLYIVLLQTNENVYVNIYFKKN